MSQNTQVYEDKPTSHDFLVSSSEQTQSPLPSGGHLLCCAIVAYDYTYIIHSGNISFTSKLFIRSSRAYVGLLKLFSLMTKFHIIKTIFQNVTPPVQLDNVWWSAKQDRLRTWWVTYERPHILICWGPCRTVKQKHLNLCPQIVCVKT